MTITRIGMSRRALLGTAVGAGAFAFGAPAISQGAAKTFVLSNHVPPSHNVAQASERFAAAVKEKSGGAINIQVRHAGQLAALRAAAEAVQIGTIDMVWADLATLANWAPEYGFMVLPFLLNGFDHVDKVLDGETFKTISAELRDKMSIEVLAYGPTGFRIMMNTKRPIKTAEDMRGLKFRVPEIPVFVDTFKALGANPTPMGIGETYTALQTGVIDGIESPADGLWSFKIPEVARHSSKTYHMFTDMNLLMNKDKFNSLSNDEKKIVQDAAREVVVGWYRKDVAGNDQKYWAMIAEKTQAVENPDLDSFRKATAPVYETFYKQAGSKGRAFVEAVIKAA